MKSMRTHSRRRGAIAPLTAAMLVVFFGLVAFAIDTAWMTTTQSELQNAADASALAGAQELFNSYTLYNLPGQSQTAKETLVANAVAAARTTAKAYAAQHTAGGVEGLNLLDADVSIGFTDATGKFTAYAFGGNYPNTIKVLLRRDDSANTPLRLFFGSVIGTAKANLYAPAAATLYVASVNGFRNPSSSNVSMLPMTYDVAYWSQFASTGKDRTAA